MTKLKLLCAGLMFCMMGRADMLLVSNFPDGQTLGFGHAVGGGAGEAVSFTGGFTITQAVLPLLGSLFAGAPPGTPVLTALTLNADAAGLPGAPLATFTQEGPIPTVAGSLITFDCVLCPTLATGSTYWLTALDPNPLTGIDWFASITDDEPYAVFVGGAWQPVEAGHATPAFRLYGNPVPEPRSILLLATIGLFLWRVGKKKPA